MALGTLTLVGNANAGGPVFMNRVSVLGVNPYVAGGMTGLLAKLRAATKDNRAIVSVQGESENGLYHAEYVHATDALFVRVIATGAEAGAIDLAAVAFVLTIVSK